MTVGLLCMSYGTARGPDDLEAYLTHIRGGRMPSPELVAEIRRRYAAIGGRSPLIEITERQTRALEAALGGGSGGVARPEEQKAESRQRADPPVRTEVRAYHGMKHQSPYLEDVVEQMAADGIDRGIGLVLAPHYSRFSVGQYVERVEKAAADAGIDFTFVESFATHPTFVAFIASRVAGSLERLPGASVVFSAHSLPARILEQGDPYARELADTADAVAARLGITEYRIAWQSAGRTGEEWLGPDLSDVIRDLASEGARAIVSCPVGFVSDHLEVLYDVDIEAKATADEAGVRLVRTESPNDDPRFIAALAAIVRDHRQKEWG